MKLNRLQAFGYHFLGSTMVAIFSSILVFFVWYRWPLAAAAGVTEIFALLLMVDVVIGPVITLIIFNTAKKELKRDVTIVLLLQICALVYGLYTVFIARPVYLVFNSDRFDLVYANDLDDKKRAKVKDIRFQSLPLLGAEVIAAQKPEAGKARNDILFSAIMGGDDVPQLPQYYVPYVDLKPQVLPHVRPLEELSVFNKEQKKEVAALVAKYAPIKTGVGFLPLRGKVADLAVIVRRDSAEVLEIKNLKPWQ
jgi:hypothetical protein